MRQEGTLRQRSKVTLHFEVRDTKRRPAQGDFAVAVTDRKAAAPVAAAGIYSTLMLSSEPARSDRRSRLVLRARQRAGRRGA